MSFFDRFKRKKEEKINAQEEVSEPYDNESLMGGVEEEAGELKSEHEEDQEDDNDIEVMDVEPADLISMGEAEKKRYARECCELVVETDGQLKRVREEYGRVTSRLTDIQRIDRIEGGDKEKLNDICKKIMNLTKERNGFRDREMTITDAQIRRFDIYEKTLSKEVKKMFDAEVYQEDIISDLGHLEVEKRKFIREEKEIVANQSVLKSMSKLLIALMVSLLIFLYVIYRYTNIDMTYPYLAVVALAAVSAFVIFSESYKNRRNAVLIGRKVNKAINLLNKVKIKYTNNRNLIDYNCEKFGVENARDFEAKWREYMVAREYDRKYRENSEALSKWSKTLISMLEGYGVVEPEVWLTQTLAITDPREMVEIRHALNTQRGKLRSRAEYNEKTRKNMLERIEKLIEDNPELKSDIIKIVEEYQGKIDKQ